MDDPAHTPDSLAAVLDRLETLADGDRARLGDLTAAFGAASFVPALMIPALLVVSPLSGIPLFSSACGLTIALIAAQMLAARRHLWLPARIKRRSIPAARLRAALARMRPPMEWIDRHTTPRLRALFHRPLSWLPQIGCVLSGAMMPFLELVPFSSSILGGAVLCFSIGLLTRDGLFLIAGGVVMAIASVIPITLWGAVTGA